MIRPLIFAVVSLFLATGTSAQVFKKHGAWFPVGPNPSAILAVDVNGDGVPEIVTADRGRLADPREAVPAHDQLSLLVRGEGTAYARLHQLSAGFGPYCLSVAKVDGQKGPAIVVGNFMAPQDRGITLLRNIGDYLFEPLHFGAGGEGLAYTKMRDGDGLPIFPTPGITAIIVEDLNGDGLEDILATGWSSDVLVFLPGEAEGYWGPAQITPAPGGPRDLVLADLDGDGKRDLAVAMYSDHAIALWKGDGTGAFVETARIGSRGKLPRRIRASDMNGDGKIDLLVSHRHADDSVVIFFGDAPFEFSLSQEISLQTGKRTIQFGIEDFLVADFDADGRSDVAVAAAANQVDLFVQDGGKNGVPLAFTREAYSYNEASPHALCAGDFNSDGKPDIGVALWGADSVALLLAQ